jgi:hypothetical protein
MYGLRKSNCKQCGVNFEGHFSVKRMFCSIKCRNSYLNSPNRNPSKNPDVKKKLSEFSKKNNTQARLMSPEARLKANISISKALTGRKMPSETKMLLSATMKRLKIKPPICHLSGSTHPNWKGGHAAERQKKYKTPEYLAFVKECLNRDRYTCQHCGAKNGDGIKVVLQVHHKLSYAEHPDFRYTPSNGVTLCRSCHYKTSKGVPRPINKTWTGFIRTCVHCGNNFKIRNGKKYCLECRKNICCPSCGSTICSHSARKNLPYYLSLQ